MGYRQRVERLTAQLESARNGPVGLTKETSNLFRDRQRVRRQKLDLGDLNHVLSVDADNGSVVAEGLTTFEQLTGACEPNAAKAFFSSAIVRAIEYPRVD